MLGCGNTPEAPGAASVGCFSVLGSAGGWKVVVGSGSADEGLWMALRPLPGDHSVDGMAWGVPMVKGAPISRNNAGCGDAVVDDSPRDDFLWNDSGCGNCTDDRLACDDSIFVDLIFVDSIFVDSIFVDSICDD